MSRTAELRTLTWLRTKGLRSPRVHVFVLATVVGLTACATLVSAADRYAVVITGASAGSAYAEKYESWRKALVAVLKQRFGYPDDHVFALGETGSAAKSTREDVQAVFDGIRVRLAPDDLLLVVLIGHGATAGEDDAKFNLIGPDLAASQWAALLKPIRGRVVFMDTTGGSFPFLRRVSSSGRVVVTATDSHAQQFETIFPEFFVKGLEDPAADLDKNGRASIWELFSYASAAVRRWYEQQGRLATERPLLDDNGDGIGREAESPGADGVLARTIYLAPEPSPAGDNESIRRRLDLERRLDDLRVRKAASDNPAQFDAEIEKLLLEIAQLSRRSR